LLFSQLQGENVVSSAHILYFSLIFVAPALKATNSKGKKSIKMRINKLKIIAI